MIQLHTIPQQKNSAAYVQTMTLTQHQTPRRVAMLVNIHNNPPISPQPKQVTCVPVLPSTLARYQSLIPSGPMMGYAIKSIPTFCLTPFTQSADDHQIATQAT